VGWITRYRRDLQKCRAEMRGVNYTLPPRPPKMPRATPFSYRFQVLAFETVKIHPPQIATRRGFLPPIFYGIQYLLTPKISRSKFNLYPFGATWILRGRSSFIRISEWYGRRTHFVSVGRTLNYWHRGWNYLVSPWNFSFLKILPYKTISSWTCRFKCVIMSRLHHQTVWFLSQIRQYTSKTHKHILFHMFYSSHVRMGRLLGADGSAKRFFTERWPSDRGQHAALNDIKIVAHTLIMLFPRNILILRTFYSFQARVTRSGGAGRM